MSDEANVLGEPVRYPTLPERQESLIRRLGECLEELDALGLIYEANHVALGRDLLLERREPPLGVLAQEPDQPIPFRPRKGH